MLSVWSETSGGSDITKFGDSSSLSLKKPKTDPEPEIRILRRGKWDDPEYRKQTDLRGANRKEPGLRCGLE
ncbi:hypothetical protein AALP_AAs50914U000100 [Arabis alpina]|uniref:Uncharacterized protein n=1 Tax=Arabis alpina TaxID=50452 RepID=A0A087FZA6_ARAAL|nr:hypothetical protein AALP_AAs50914U000100 [Arabis alpina]